MVVGPTASLTGRSPSVASAALDPIRCAIRDQAELSIRGTSAVCKTIVNRYRIVQIETVYSPIIALGWCSHFVDLNTPCR